MKIVIDARLYGLENAGLGRYVMNLINELQLLDKKNEYVILLRKKYFDALKLPSNWKKILIDFRHYSFKEQYILPLMLYRQKPDLVHFPHFNVPILYFGKFVVTIHDFIMHKFVAEDVTTLPKPLYTLRRLGYKAVFRKAIQSSSKIIVPTNEVKKEVQKYYPNIRDTKIVYTYEGYNTVYTDKNNDTKVFSKYKLKTPYFVYFGNAYPHKNLNLLIEGIKQYSQKYDPVMLLISSSRNVFTERLKKKIKELKSEKYIVLPGFVEDRELSALLKYSSGFIYPSLMEGFGLQGLEAMASGTLVLASNIPVFREVYDNTVIFFDPINISSLLSAIKKSLDMDEVERNDWIVKAREFIKRYSWGKMAKETLEVYREASN